MLANLHLFVTHDLPRIYGSKCLFCDLYTDRNAALSVFIVPLVFGYPSKGLGTV